MLTRLMWRLIELSKYCEIVNITLSISGTMHAGTLRLNEGIVLHLWVCLVYIEMPWTVRG